MKFNPVRYARGLIHSCKSRAARRKLLGSDSAGLIDGDNFALSLENPTAYYEAAFVDFHRTVPQAVRDHRRYFSQMGRGFGEDAFHVMWWRLFCRFKPQSFLEIGVYRGQVISLLALLAKLEDAPCPVTGISPFSPVGDSVSKYRSDLNYFQDTLENFRHFGLAEPVLLQAYSTDPSAVALIRSRNWDMIYIDGNHDYEIVSKDWRICAESIKPGGLIVLDDSGLGTSYTPPLFASGGHPGPSRIAAEIDHARFDEILQVGHNRVFQRKN